MLEIHPQLKSLLRELNEHGKSIIYGGYIRDTIIGIPPNDVDIATNVSIESLTSLFPKHNYRTTTTGIDVISFKKGSHFIEITPYNEDLHTKTIHSDFTLNSMYYDGEKVFDPFNGIEDINNKTIKAIEISALDGIFSSSPFRIIKPFTLASRANFEIDTELLDFISKKMFLLDSISENIKLQEAMNIITSDYPLKGLNLLAKTGLISNFDAKTNNIDKSIFKMPKKYHLYLAYLSLVTNESTIDDFIEVFSLPTLVKQKYKKLISYLQQNELPTDFHDKNEYLFLSRFVTK